MQIYMVHSYMLTLIQTVLLKLSYLKKIQVADFFITNFYIELYRDGVVDFYLI